MIWWSKPEVRSALEGCRDLAQQVYRDIDGKYRRQLIELRTTEMANSDLEKYHKVTSKPMQIKQLMTSKHIATTTALSLSIPRPLKVSQGASKPPDEATHDLETHRAHYNGKASKSSFTHLEQIRVWKDHMYALTARRVVRGTSLNGYRRILCLALIGT